MVYIAPLPKAQAAKRSVLRSTQTVGGQQTDDRKQQPGSEAFKQPAKPGRRQQQQQDQQEQLPQTHAKGSKRGKSVTARPKQAQEPEPDVEHLMACQAALATRILQREQAALQPPQQPRNSSPQRSTLGAPTVQCNNRQVSLQPLSGANADPQVPDGAWLATGPVHPDRPAADCQAATQQHPQHPQEPRQPQQRQHQQLEVRAIGGAAAQKNHMFWDAAAKSLSPSQVPGLLEQAGPSQPTPAARSTTITQQRKPLAQRAGRQQQAAQAAPAQRRQHKQVQESAPQVLPVPALSAANDMAGGRLAAARQLEQAPTAYQHTAYADAGDSTCAHAAISQQPLLQQQQQQQQQGPGPILSSSVTPLAGAAVQQSAGSSSTQLQPLQGVHAAQQQQRQPQLPAVAAAADDASRPGALMEALQAAEQHHDPAVRHRLVKDIKQQLYKLELEQQIAERAAARRASKAAADAREAAEAAARAAAPPPWDASARLSRQGGGGEPLKGLDGALVADLRNQRHMLPAPGLEGLATQQLSSPAGSPPRLAPGPQHHQQQQQGQPGHEPSTSSGCVLPVSTPPAVGHPGPSADTSIGTRFSPGATTAAPQASGPKGFLGSLAELRPGPSHEQRAAAAAARQQLQRDLEAQIADRHARASAAAAAEAARAAAEEAALQQYLLTKSSSQADVGVAGKEASVVYAAAGPLNVQATAQAFVPNSSSGSSRSGVRKQQGRSRRVIDAPWLDQLQPARQTSQQPLATLDQHHGTLQQQGSHGQLPHHVVQHHGQQQLWQEASSLRPGAAATGADTAGTLDAGSVSYRDSAAGLSSGLQQVLPPAAPLRHSMNSQQLSAALQQVQQLQQEQMRMFHDFKQQAQELQQLLADKQALAADRDTARHELGRVQELLQQQKELQDAYSAQQQVLLQLQQQQQQQQAHGAVRASSLHLDHSGPCADLQDCLDAFVVETQMVPITMNNILAGAAADTQAVSDLSGPSSHQPCSAAEHPGPALPVAAVAAATGRQHKSRYSSFYGLEAELPNVSIASQIHSPKGARKGRSRVSGGFRPGPAAAAAAAAPDRASISSSLAASTSFVPCALTGQLHHQASGREQEQPDGGGQSHSRAAASTSRRLKKPGGTAAVVAAGTAAGKKLSWPKGATGTGKSSSPTR